MKSWDERIDYAERKPVRTGLRIVLIVAGFCAIIGVLSIGFGWCSESAKVVQAELGPSALLKKYEWFKNASASLDEKVATIAVYEERNKQMQIDYGKPTAWPRDLREQNSIWQSELAGIKASYNLLASDYNAQMAKINWAFCNVGSLPAGADKVLPRDYKPYINQ